MAGEYVSTSNEPIEVPFSDDSEEVRDDELIEDAPANLSPAERATRDEKKRERIKRKLDEGKASKEENERLRAQLAEQNTRLARLEGAVSVQRQPAQPQGDPYAARMAAARARQNEAYLAAQAEINAKTFDDKRADHWARVAAEIEDEKMAIQAERIMAQRMPAIRTEQAQQVYVQKYPEIYKPENSRAFEYAQGRWKQRTAMGEPESAQLVDEIMKEAMTQFKIGPKTAPTATERDRLSGRGSSSSGSSSSSPSGGIQMTKDLRKMATAMYSELPEAEAIKKWTDTVGKPLRQKKIL